MIPACLPDDWAFWPEREDLSAEFMRLLAAAQEGGATIAECLLIARRIRRGDELSWHREWLALAQTNRERGDAAFAGGHIATAQRNWLRAISYYNAAALPLDATDARRTDAVLAMQGCARSFLKVRSPAGEVVTLPWLNGHSLQGYFVPARSTGRPAATVVCIGEPGHRKEEFLIKLAPFARERGLSMLAIDLLGERSDDGLDGILRRRDLETSITAIMDYLSSRADVDSGRVAILADGWGSSFVARAIVHEPRLAAAVCDGGLWDLHERAFLANRVMQHDASLVPGPEATLIARDIDCPVLITLGDDGWLKPDRARQMVQQVRSARPDVTLRVFTAEETAAAQSHADNPSLANEYIFDWLASRLGALPA
ncbi:alpha/beta hydrolase family protein [Bradyrhizobium iriomotense]|uniref:Dienelactone hydrolase n=1 Tax=Bradyrhizobium iriomotense TaxID=441950 RepID=A0ABQ6AW86_9BRAD|nr:dienelactone hydrolase [Bradyrhizobium iriomotense]GLR84880.1 dienelactone hydrolase [Bradyrhizobium iriomotense]